MGSFGTGDAMKDIKYFTFKMLCFCLSQSKKCGHCKLTTFKIFFSLNNYSFFVICLSCSNKSVLFFHRAEAGGRVEWTAVDGCRPR